MQLVNGKPGASRDEIIRFCDELLASESFEDYGPNGIQVPGRAEVRTVVTGVSAHLELIERAVDVGADLLLAHHGLLWNSQPRALSEPMAARLRAALTAELTIAAYHLPLDAHHEIGNNALLCAALGFEAGDGFAQAGGQQIGVVGTAPEPMPAADLSARISELLDREPLLLGAGPDLVETLGIVSGGGAAYVREAAALGLDAMLTGEPTEYATADAREAGLHFYAAGHHATERLGIRRLGERISERFGVRHEFIDVPNPV